MGACCTNTHKSQEEKRIIFLLFLSNENQEYVSEQFKGQYDISFDKLMIFSNCNYNQHKLFVTNGAILSSSEECYLYLENCSLEGTLSQIVILVDLNTFRKNFSSFSYVKLLQSNRELKEQTRMLLLYNSNEYLSNQDQEQLKQYRNVEYSNKFTELKDRIQVFLDSPNNCSIQLHYNIPPIKNIDEYIEICEQMIQNKKQKINQLMSIKQIDDMFKIIVDFRNNIIYQYSSQNNNNDKIPNHRNALYFKFNIKMLKLLQEFTQFIFKQIEKILLSVEQYIKICHMCSTIFYVNGQWKLKIKCFNNSLTSCKNCCQNLKKNQQQLDLRFKKQLEFFTLNRVIEKLQKNELNLKWQEQKSIERGINRYNKQREDVVTHKQEQKNENCNSNIQSSKEILEIQDKHIMLIGKSGVGKTIIFKKLTQKPEYYLNQNQYNQNQETHDIQLQKSQNSAFTVIDTPSFELLDEKKILDSEKIEMFSNIFTSNKLCQIFIITNYDRIDNMKEKIMDCFKFLHKFKTKISIIILNHKNKIEPDEEIREIEKNFGLKCLYFNQADQERSFIEKITDTINSSIDEYLDLDDTKFDIKKNQLAQSQFNEKLLTIKNQQQITKILEEIQVINTQNEEKKNQRRHIIGKQKKLESQKQQLLNELQQIFQQLESLVEDQNETLKQEQRIDQEEKELEMQKLRLEKKVIELKCKQN